MLSLPNELLLDIFELVTHVPGLLDVHPSPNKVFFPEKEKIDDLIEEFFQTLSTRRSLPLVSRAFNAVATPLLYACIVLSPLSTFRLSGSLDDKKGSLVRHVIMDFPGHDWNRPERDLVRIFAHFSAVRVLSVRSRSTSQFWFRRQLGGAPLLRAMRMALCPTLRKLVLQEHALSLFTHRHLSKFTSCLVHLEALVALNLKPSQMRIPFPKSLPRLSYVDIQSAPFNLPANITPTHVRTFSDPLSTPLTGVLTHLSLSITNTTSLTAYASLSIACPALDSLTLSGPLPRITHVLVNYLLPAVRNLAFTDLAISVMGGL